MYPAFYVLAAYGYPAGSTTGKLYHLAVYRRCNTAAWPDFLARYSGAPRVVVADRATATRNVVLNRRRGAAAPDLVMCSWHLAANVRAAFTADGVKPPKKKGSPNTPPSPCSPMLLRARVAG
jgi:hypothetical protein